MGVARVHEFRTDRRYELRVLDVSVGSEAGAGSYSERVDVIFLEVGAGRHPRGGDARAGRPKACIAMHFDADWTPRDEETARLLRSLGVPIPVPPGFDWEGELADRRIIGRFDRSPRQGARNPLAESIPADQDPRDQESGKPDRVRVTGSGILAGDRHFEPENGAGSRGTAGSGLPRWDGQLRKLIWEGEAIVSYARLAKNQTIILAAFEEEGWPAKIDDPLCRGRLRPTLADLQAKFRDTPLSFHGDGSGEAVRWEPRKA